MDEIPIKRSGDSTGPYTVSGVVREPDGTPLANATVQVFDQELRSLTPLGQHQSGKDGSYLIRYEIFQLKQPGKTSADLVVKATAADGSLIAQTPTLFHAPRVAQIDVTRGNQPYLGPAELTAVQTALTPILGTVKAADLTASDISYLNSATGLPPLQIQQLALASQSAAASSIDPHVFYGLTRKGFPVTLDRLLSTDPAAQQQALNAAVQDNLIPPSLAPNIPQLVAQLQQTAVSRTLAPGATRLGGVLSVSLSDAKLQTTFADTFLANRTSGDAFWKALAAQPGFTTGEVASTQLGVQLASLTQYHAPLVTALLAQQQQGTFASLADLAKFGAADWLNLINSDTPAGGPVGVPAGVPGANASEMAQNYAEVLSRRLEAAFPTAAVGAQLATSNLAGAAAISSFLNANPDFDIAATNAVTYVAAKQAPEQVVQNLPAMQRVFKVAPRFEQMEPLLAAGLNSARAIAGMPVEQFMAQFGTVLGGTGEAQAVYARAQLFSQSAAHIFGQYATSLNGNNPRLLGGAPDSAPQIPNWTALFGSPDFCACSDCQSILSPAAYLVDLLNQFVDPYITDGSGHKGTALLFARRPDINTLQLSCDNTNTTLPYIDLVNELLEDAVSPGTAVAHDSTDGSSDDLGAAPEYLNQGAYTTLAQQVFPWNLPFDLGLSQARIYLKNLGVNRYDLMQAFQASPTAPDPTDAALTGADAIAADEFGLSPLGWKILTGVSGHQPWELWGVTNADWSNTWTKAAPGPTVQQFLTQSGIAFQDLVDLLTTRLAQQLAPAPNPVLIQWADANGESCDLTQATLLNLSATVLDGFLRFLRLRNVLGATVLGTDKLVGALGPAFDAAFVRQAALAAGLQNQLGLPWPELASWWANIPTLPDVFEGTSLYQRLFLNPAITNPLDTVFALNAGGTELADTSHFLEDAAHQPTVLAGLQVSATDLNLLLAALPLEASGGQHMLNLANLSELFRTASLARALNLGISDFLTAVALLSLNLNPISGGSPPPAPFDPARVADAVWVVKQAAFIQTSGFSLAELNYLLLDGNASSSPLAPAVSDLAQQLTTLCTGLQPILAQTGGVNPNWSNLGGAFVAQQLSGWLPLPIPAVAAWLTSMADGFPNSYQDTFLDPAFVATPPPVAPSAVTAALAAPVPVNPAAAPPLYYQARALIKLRKIAVIAGRLKLQTADLAWLEANAAPLGWLDLNALPPFGAAPPPLYTGWVTLVTMAQLRTTLIPGQPFPNLLPAYPAASAPPAAVYLAALSTLASWDLPDLQTVCGAAGLNFNYPNDFWQPATLLRIQTAFGLLAKLGATASQVLPWTHASITLQQGNDITTLVKGHYSVAQWPATGKSLRDPLRQQQRDGLSQYLIFNSPTLFGQQFTSSDDLFGYFLIDTQMSSCMQTSRIVQATQSVQTFISRCLLNLESGVTVAAVASQYWTWMKQYRLWQANREVFLYPENYLDPTLRDDQTTFFQTLAQAMHQKEVTADSVETAFLNYLTSLDGVARLQVSGMYHDLDPTNAIDTLYVFARTMGSPTTFYLRQFVNSSYWTEWEKIDLDIPAIDVIPVIYNRRLYVFWPVIKTLSAKSNSMSAPSPGESGYTPTPTPTWVQIQVAWSQYWQGTWAAKKTSDPPGLLIPVEPTIVGSGLVPSQNEAYFPSPFNCIYSQALRPDGTVDPTFFQFKAVPPASGDTSDQMQIACYVVHF
ncbi:MAG: neuraminidase-like domain-containing protein [Bryobacteraceae bacterium]